MPPCEKDDTDTVLALKKVDKKGFDAFLFLDASGGRPDHTSGDVST